jgi:hypothetical protein
MVTPEHSSLGFYEALGFVLNRANDYRDRQNPSMRIDLFGELDAWTRG